MAVTDTQTEKNAKCTFVFLDGAPNYYRNNFNGPDVTNVSAHLEHATFESGMATRHDASEDDNFSQPRIFYQVSVLSISFLMFDSTSTVVPV